METDMEKNNMDFRMGIYFPMQGGSREGIQEQMEKKGKRTGGWRDAGSYWNSYAGSSTKRLQKVKTVLFIRHQITTEMILRHFSYCPGLNCSL